MTSRKRNNESLSSQIRQLDGERKKIKAEIKRREALLYPQRSALYARIRANWLRDRARSRLYIVRSKPEKDGDKDEQCPMEVDMKRLPTEPRKHKLRYTKMAYLDDERYAHDEDEEIDPGEEFADKTVEHGIDRGEYAMS